MVGAMMEVMEDMAVVGVARGDMAGEGPGWVGAALVGASS